MSRMARWIGLVGLVALAAAACSSEQPPVAGPAEPPAEAGHEEEHAEVPGHTHEVKEPFLDTIVRRGVKVEFSLLPQFGVGGLSAEEIVEGGTTAVRFRISDNATGDPLTGLQPAAWVDLRPSDEQPAASCGDRVQSYLGGALTARPVVDLNGYYILALNNDASISVINPVVDVAGYTQLFAMVLLDGPGEDWAMSEDLARLFVTMPESGAVAVVDTETFEVIENVEAGRRPVRVALQPNGRRVWVGDDGSPGGRGGVAVLDARRPRLVAEVPLGAGHHEIAFAPGGSHAFVTNSDEGTLSIIDARALEKIRDVRVGSGPASVAVSRASRDVYVANEGDGTITVLDGETFAVVARMNAARGLEALSFAPGGRWGFAASPSAGEVHVFDATTNRIRRVVEVAGEPDQISFGGPFAYVRARDTAEVTTIRLVDLRRSRRLRTATVDAGQQAPEESPFSSVASAIAPTPDEAAMLIANPADGVIYYHAQGGSSPTGSFQGHGRAPRAVRVIDRSLREREPGLYTGNVRIPSSGEHEVAFLLTSPRIVHCFGFEVEPNTDLAAEGRTTARLELLTTGRMITPGERFTIRVRLEDARTNEPLAGVGDVVAVAVQTGGNWNERYASRHVGDGVYEMRIAVPDPGLYEVFFAARSLQADYSDFPTLRLEAAAP